MGTRSPDVPSDGGHAIIAGYGLPGRSVATELRAAGVRFCVIERNPDTVNRCESIGVCIIEGDARDVATLEMAGVDNARLLAVALPDEAAGLAVVEAARRLNPRLHIIARCTYTSAGLAALRGGADETVVAEQAVADAFARAVRGRVGR